MPVDYRVPGEPDEPLDEFVCPYCFSRLLVRVDASKRLYYCPEDGVIMKPIRRSK